MATAEARSRRAHDKVVPEGPRGSPRGEPPSDSDVALVVRIARGDHDALAALFDRHAAAVHSLAARLGGSDQADEVVQDVFVRLWQRPERFDVDRGSLRTFLHTDTHGRAVDLLRSNGARRNREFADFARQTPHGVAVDDAAVAALFHDDVAKAIATLPRRERDPIVLAYFGGHSYCEVAAMLKQPEGTIKSRIRAGLKRLRTELLDWHLAAGAPRDDAVTTPTRSSRTRTQLPNRTRSGIADTASLERVRRRRVVRSSPTSRTRRSDDRRRDGDAADERGPALRRYDVLDTPPDRTFEG